MTTELYIWRSVIFGLGHGGLGNSYSIPRVPFPCHNRSCQQGLHKDRFDECSLHSVSQTHETSQRDNPNSNPKRNTKISFQTAHLNLGLDATCSNWTNAIYEPSFCRETCAASRKWTNVCLAFAEDIQLLRRCTPSAGTNTRNDREGVLLVAQDRKKQYCLLSTYIYIHCSSAVRELDEILLVCTNPGLQQLEE